MIMNRRIFAVLGAFLLPLLTAGPMAVPASATEDPVVVCVPAAPQTFTTGVSGRPDSGLNGTWAHDFFMRTTVVADNCDGTYTLTITDEGEFTTISGAQSPNGPAMLAPSFTGEFSGGATVKVTSATPPHAPTGGTDGKVSTGDWAALLFGEVKTEMTSWGWSYSYCGEKWVNASTGNSGNVTGLPCTVPAQRYWLKVEGTDCTPTAQADVVLTAKIEGSKWHAPLMLPYWVNGKKEMASIGVGEVYLELGITAAEDANNGKLKVTFGEGKRARSVVVNTNCHVPTTTTTPPSTATTTTTPAPATSTTTTTPVVVQQASSGKSDDLAYTGASGLGTLLTIGLLVLAAGGAVLLIARRRKSTS
jgi:LPXTG-motif cell wall-anchored protein